MKTIYLILTPPWISGVSNLIPDPGAFNTLLEATTVAEQIGPHASVVPVRMGHISDDALRTWNEGTPVRGQADFRPPEFPENPE